MREGDSQLFDFTSAVFVSLIVAEEIHLGWYGLAAGTAMFNLMLIIPRIKSILKQRAVKFAKRPTSEDRF
jgi:predicted small integral membrane protein